MKKFIVAVGFVILGVYIATTHILDSDPASGSLFNNTKIIGEKMINDTVNYSGS